MKLGFDHYVRPLPKLPAAKHTAASASNLGFNTGEALIAPSIGCWLHCQVDCLATGCHLVD